MSQVVDIERDIIKAKAGSGSDLVYKTITGLTSDLAVESKPVVLEGEIKVEQTPEQNKDDGDNGMLFFNL